MRIIFTMNSEKVKLGITLIKRVSLFVEFYVLNLDVKKCTRTNCLYRCIVLKNSFLYASDGRTKIKNVNIGGINEMKYPIR